MLVLNRWACGVILFTLLAGSPPFWHRKQMLMLRMIMEGRYQFSSPEWDDRSDTVKDLVRRIKLQQAQCGFSQRFQFPWRSSSNNSHNYLIFDVRTGNCSSVTWHFYFLSKFFYLNLTLLELWDLREHRSATLTNLSSVCKDLHVSLSLELRYHGETIRDAVSACFCCRYPDCWFWNQLPVSQLSKH